MAYVAIAIGVLIAVVGATGVASPARLLSTLERYRTPGGLYFATAVRVILGVALILVAPESRAPDLVRVLGVVAVAAGILAPILGLERVGQMLDWWSSRSTAVLRAWSTFAMGFGLIVVWAVAPAI
jgi:hypothetical protein